MIKTAAERIDAFGNFAVTNGAHITVYTDRNKAMLLATKEEADELRAAYEALQKENNSLKLGYKAKEFILQEAQKEVAKLRSFDADNKGLKECNSILTAENEALRKELEEFEAERNRRDEMRKALETQMNGE